MNDSNYIIKNIAMLKRNTINVKNLTNKFCLELSRNFGIDRTEELESTISELLTKYKSGEIDDNVVVQRFDEILNVSSNSNNTINYSQNKTGYDKKRDANVKSTSNDNNKLDSQSVKDSISNKVSKNTEDKKNVKEQASSIIDSNLNSSNINNTESVDINNNKTIPEVKEEVQSNTFTASTGALKPICDINTDDIGKIINICSSIDDGLSNATITVPAKAMPYSGAVISATEGVKSISTSFDGIKGAMLSAIIGVQENDVFYDASKFSWDEIIKIYDKSKNSEVVSVDIDFFRDKCEIIDDRYAILNINGRECKYDTKKHQFYVDGKVAFNVDVFVPEGSNDYSKLNTYTYFMGSGYNKHITDGKDGQGGKGQSTNAVLIQIMKKDSWNAYGETALMTKFINEVANTDLNDNHCRNIVGGDSVYGTHALKTAAQSGNLYQTVYCIDNAVIATGYNNHGGDKTQMTEDEVRALDGKDVYFISVAGDPNLNHGKTHPSFASKGGSYKEGYTYTGLVHLLDVCPNVKAYMVYPENAPGAHNNEMEIYRELEKQYPEQYQYIPEAWDNFSNFDYQNHTQGNYVPAEASKSSVTNYNYYCL